MRKLRKYKSLYLAKPVFFLLLFILNTIACRCQSNNSEGTTATDKGKLKTESGLADTLGGIKGKIVDSVTNEPVPFVKITIYNDSGSMAIMSNAKGEFYITSKHLKSNVLLSSIGYQIIPTV